MRSWFLRHLFARRWFGQWWLGRGSTGAPDRRRAACVPSRIWTMRSASISRKRRGGGSRPACRPVTRPRPRAATSATSRSSRKSRAACGDRRVSIRRRQDLRYGLRLLARHRLFAIFSIVSLALGIGGTSAVFSLFDAIVLRDLPVSAPDAARDLVDSKRRPAVELVHAVSAVRGHAARQPIRRRPLRADGRRTASASARRAAPISWRACTVTGDITARSACSRRSAACSRRPTIAPAAPPWLSSATRTGSAASAASASILGATLTLNQVPFTVVGVEPPGFFGVTLGSAPDVIMPMQAHTLLMRPPAAVARGVRDLDRGHGAPAGRRVARAGRPRSWGRSSGAPASTRQAAPTADSDDAKAARDDEGAGAGRARRGA